MFNRQDAKNARILKFEEFAFPGGPGALAVRNHINFI
jgi:hypothetical protein